MSKFDKTVNQYLLEAVQPDGPIIDAYGNKRWRKDGKLHREDGPAVEWDNGSKEWFIDGKLHREDGPAVVWANGDKEWYINGNQHRLDGTAVELANGDKAWYINGNQHRLDGPAVELANGDKEWFINDIELTPAEIHELKQKIELNNRVTSDTDNAISDLWGAL